LQGAYDRHDVAGITDRRQPEDAETARRFGERQHGGVSYVNGRWALGPEVKRGALKRGAMLYDASRAGNLSAEWFTPNYWQSLGALEGAAGGRGGARLCRAARQRSPP